MSERVSFIDPEWFNDPESGVRKLKVDPEEVACVANLAGLSRLTGEEDISLLHRLTSEAYRRSAEIFGSGYIRFCRFLDEDVFSDDEFIFFADQLANAATSQDESDYHPRLNVVQDYREHVPKPGEPKHVPFLQKALAPIDDSSR